MCVQPLAVRHKDFHRNIKKHYAKLLKVLQAYAVSSTNVKISVANTTGKHGTRQVVISTQAHHSMGDNIASVFGTKFARTLVSVQIDLNEACKRAQLRPKPTSSRARSGSEEIEEGGDDDDEDVEMSASQMEKKREVVGYVSKVGAGVGRSDNDRQFFFINGRPFDLPKVRGVFQPILRRSRHSPMSRCRLQKR